MPVASLNLINPTTCHGESSTAREWMLEGWIPRRQGTYLTGGRGEGKSLMSQLLATCMALGLPFTGVETRHAASIYVTCEDGPDELWRRQRAICDGLQAKALLTSAKPRSLIGDG